MNKNQQIKVIESILDKIKSDKYNLDGLGFSQGVVEKDNYETGWVDHHESGDITIKLHITDNELAKKAKLFLSD